MTTAATRAPDGGRGAEHAETRRPDLEHVTGEHRQEGDRAAEEHGEEIERDRAEEHGRPPDESDAAEDAREVRGALADALAAGTQCEDRDEGDDRETRCDRIDELRVDREEQPAERRAADDGRLERGRPLGECANEKLLRHERRHEGPPGRRTEGGSDARPEREEVERPGLLGARPCHGEEADRHDRVERDRHREHGAPRVPVGEVSCRECEQRQRQEHREPDEAEVERIAIDRIDLPPDRDERHLDRECGRHGGDDVEREVPVAER